MSSSFLCLRRAVISLTIALCATCLVAQEEEEEASGFQIKPTIGLGVGVLGFSGDIGDQHSDFNPLLSRVAYELRASSPINNYLEAGFYVIQGKVGANERSSTRNLNFESKISTGGIQLKYNFDHFLKRDREIEPYVTIGIESMEFLSKTDLFDANGNRYFYWSDGTIRNIDENAPNAFAAATIERDYVYESDIRELDLDGFGSYSERTFAIPIGAGIQTNFEGGFDLRFGASVHYAFSDLIDGVSDQSVEGRTGDSKNDFLIFTSFTIGYEINTSGRKRSGVEDFWNPDMLALLAQSEDEDGDGVADVIDDSPFTPEGVAVDERGVPLDGDGDFVFDYVDQQLDTDSATSVHPTGIGMTDEDHLLAYQIFVDSTGQFASKAHSFAISSGTATPGERKNQRKFVVQVGSEFEGIAPGMVDRILGLPDVRSVEIGDTTYLVVGGFNDLPDAIRRQMELEEQGITSQVKEETGTGLVNVDREIQALLPLDAGPRTDNSMHIIRVQLGAFRYPLSKDIFEDVKDLVVLTGEDGLTRYYSGNFLELKDAADFKVKKLLEGFEGAFLVAFKEGKRVSLSDVGAVLMTEESLENSSEPTLIDKSRISYRIQVGLFEDEVPADIMELYIDLGEVKAVRGKNSVKYLHGKFTTREEADAQLLKVRSLGLPEAFVIGDFNGTLITGEEADNLLKQ